MPARRRYYLADSFTYGQQLTYGQQPFFAHVRTFDARLNLACSMSVQPYAMSLITGVTYPFTRTRTWRFRS